MFINYTIDIRHCLLTYIESRAAMNTIKMISEHILAVLAPKRTSLKKNTDKTIMMLTIIMMGE